MKMCLVPYIIFKIWLEHHETTYIEHSKLRMTLFFLYKCVQVRIIVSMFQHAWLCRISNICNSKKNLIRLVTHSIKESYRIKKQTLAFLRFDRIMSESDIFYLNTILENIALWATHLRKYALVWKWGLN